MMEKRILLAVSLSFVVLVIYQTLLPPPPADSRPDGARTVPAEEERAELPETKPSPSVEAQSLDVPAPKAESTPNASEAVAPLAEPTVAATSEERTTVENSRFRAVFSNRGGVLVSWQLKEFLDPQGAPEELVPQSIEGAVRPFSLTFADADPAIAQELGSALYRTTVDGLDGDETAGTLVFDYDNGSGLKARKTFTFDPRDRPYVVRVSAAVEDANRALDPVVQWGPGLADTPYVGRGAQSAGGIYYQDGDTTRLAAADVADAPVPDGSFSFVGIDDHYFTSVLLPGDRTVHVQYRAVPRPSIDPDQEVPALVAYDVQAMDGPFTNLDFFVGPKSFDTLAQTHPDLIRAIDFGVFSFLAVPLLRALKWINSFIGNYGWSIIILTVLINAVMFPLRHKSVVSMRKMQEIQPEVKAIQERYASLKATDPAKQKMNAELMNLYRERGVNPASGCLPMLLTMPVLFAFYSLLSVAIEIRGAPFMLWITDLSAHDPFYVTPIIMGVTMVWQQRNTPSTADPTQQKVMMFMPIMFTFMFLWASSGLVLYWLCSNLWAIGQQAVTNRIIGPPVIKNVRPPAERRMKKGRTKSPKDGQ